ncbi:hypothetical protein FPV67DRAFT_243566 [Lyophyllum atratum]|nr:hypothetical protein FPV67DRAFT_243566 [Lyophyllum atratum]
MHFTVLFIAISLAVSIVAATPAPLERRQVIFRSLFFDQYCSFLGTFIVRLQILCGILIPCTTTITATTTATTTTTHSETPVPTPTPTPAYTQPFTNEKCATQAGDYLTFDRAATVAACEARCSEIPGCVFVNSYLESKNKGQSLPYSCAFFSKCHTKDDNKNCGGQVQEDGSTNNISSSTGSCKKQ